MRIDMEDFFPTIERNRVGRLFMLMGYPERVAKLLAGICTTVTPDELWDEVQSNMDWSERRRTRDLYQRAHLPQGAPTSPAISNLIAHRLDTRLQGLANASRIHYTRYADDMVFSGGAWLLRHAKSFHIYVSSIILEEGFQINPRKTRIMPAAQQQRAGGLVLNTKPNVSRREYDELKATLFNCVNRGPASQNCNRHSDFRAHLIGRVNYVERINARRGQKLRRLLDCIDWTQ